MYRQSLDHRARCVCKVNWLIPPSIWSWNMWNLRPFIVLYFVSYWNILQCALVPRTSVPVSSAISELASALSVFVCVCVSNEQFTISALFSVPTQILKCSFLSTQLFPFITWISDETTFRNIFEIRSELMRMRTMIARINCPRKTIFHLIVVPPLMSDNSTQSVWEKSHLRAASIVNRSP